MPKPSSPTPTSKKDKNDREEARSAPPIQHRRLFANEPALSVAVSSTSSKSTCEPNEISHNRPITVEIDGFKTDTSAPVMVATAAAAASHALDKMLLTPISKRLTSHYSALTAVIHIHAARRTCL